MGGFSDILETTQAITLTIEIAATIAIETATMIGIAIAIEIEIATAIAIAAAATANRNSNKNSNKQYTIIINKPHGKTKLKASVVPPLSKQIIPRLPHLEP